MFLLNSRQEIFRCGPHCWGRTLSLSYGRFFAEFLKGLSLVRLGLLDQTTCVGLRYGIVVHNLRSFSRKRAHIHWQILRFTSHNSIEFLIKQNAADFPTAYPQSKDDNPISRVHYSPSSLHRTLLCHGILTVCPSPPPLGIGLGPTNSSLITIAKKTLVFRRRGFLPRLRLLVLAFSLLYAPPRVSP